MKFLLESNGSLKYTNDAEYDDTKSILVDQQVMIYDYCNESNDSLHLVYLQLNGTLNHVLFKGGRMTESIIGKFDTKSNQYTQISILLINGKINIFYSYSNVINSNIYTLHHVIITNNKQDKYNIIKYVSKKQDHSFVVDSDSGGNIHLFYNTVSENFSYIFYTYFNPYKNQWLSNPVKLSNSENHSEHPGIYVDNKDNIHGVLWERNPNGFLLKYKRMSSAGKNMFKWSDISIPTIIQEDPESIIYQKEGNIIIECKSYILVSNDDGMSWIKEDKKIVLKEEESPSNNFNMVEEVDVEVIEEDEEVIDNHKYNIDMILLNQDAIKLLIESIMDEQHTLRSKVESLEEDLKSSKTGFKKFFSS